QAEAGIRDPAVTGVQTCALPISQGGAAPPGPRAVAERAGCRGRAGGRERRSGRAAPRNSALLSYFAWLSTQLQQGTITSEGQLEIGRASCREKCGCGGWDEHGEG